MAKKRNFNQDFSTRLKKLMDKHHVSVVELSNKIGITRQAITNYLNCQSIPNINICKDIADFFNVSSDYLLGKDTQPKKSDEDLYNELGLTSKTLEKLRTLRREAYNHESSAYLLFILNALIQAEDIESEDGFLSELKDYVLYSYKKEAYFLDKDEIDSLLKSENPGFISPLKSKMNGEEIEDLKLFRLQTCLKDFKVQYKSLYSKEEEMEIFRYTNKPNEDGYFLIEDSDKQVYYKDGKYYYCTPDGYFPYEGYKK